MNFQHVLFATLPAQFHVVISYIQVIHGMLQAHPSTIKSREHWIELTCHESARVFYDRLTDENDRSYFCDVVAHVLKESFKVKWSPEMLGPNSLLFGDFLDLNVGEHERMYKCVRDPKQLLQVLEACFRFPTNAILFLYRLIAAFHFEILEIFS